MRLRDRLARAWAHRKLRRGRCEVCDGIFADDWAGGPICDSADCRWDHQAATAW